MTKMSVFQRRRSMINVLGKHEKLTFPIIKEWFTQYFPHISQQNISWDERAEYLYLQFDLPTNLSFINKIRDNIEHFNRVTEDYPITYEILYTENYMEIHVHYDSWFGYMASAGVDWINLDDYYKEHSVLEQKVDQTVNEVDQKYDNMIKDLESSRVDFIFDKHFPKMPKSISWISSSSGIKDWSISLNVPYLKIQQVIDQLMFNTQKFIDMNTGDTGHIEFNGSSLLINIDYNLLPDYLRTVGKDWIVLDSELSKEKSKEEIFNKVETLDTNQNWLNDIDIGELLRCRLSQLINNGQFDHLIIRDVEKLLQ